MEDPNTNLEGTMEYLCERFEKLLNEANQNYKSNLFDVAIIGYTSILKDANEWWFRYGSSRGIEVKDRNEKENEGEKTIVSENSFAHEDRLKVSLLHIQHRTHSNRGMAFLQIREYEKVINDCLDALRLGREIETILKLTDLGLYHKDDTEGKTSSSEEENQFHQMIQNYIKNMTIKLFLRKSIASLSLGKLRQSYEDVEKVLELKPSITLYKQAVAHRNEVIKLLSLKPEVVSDLSGVPIYTEGGLVYETQTLRIGFRSMPPMLVSVGYWFSFSINLTNEFDLWNSKDFPCTGDMEIVVSLDINDVLDSDNKNYSDKKKALGQANEEVRAKYKSKNHLKLKFKNRDRDNRSSIDSSSSTMEEGNDPNTNNNLTLTYGGNGKAEIDMCFVTADDKFEGFPLGFGSEEAQNQITCQLAIGVRPIGVEKVTDSTNLTNDDNNIVNPAVMVRRVIPIISLPITVVAAPKEIENTKTKGNEGNFNFLISSNNKDCLQENEIDSFYRMGQPDELGVRLCRALTFSVPDFSVSLNESKDSASRCSPMNKTAASDVQVQERKRMHVLIGEASSQLGIGGKIWDASLVLIDFIAKNALNFIRNKKCIEIGSGTGAFGIACGVLGANDITLTDLPTIVPLIRKNIILNNVEDRVHVVSHIWGTPIVDRPSDEIKHTIKKEYSEHKIEIAPVNIKDENKMMKISSDTNSNVPLSEDFSAQNMTDIVPYNNTEDLQTRKQKAMKIESKDTLDAENNSMEDSESNYDESHLLFDHGYDAVLMADVVYEPEHYNALVQSMRSLSHSDTVIFHAHRKRHADEIQFFDEVKKYFLINEEMFQTGDSKDEEISNNQRKSRTWCDDIKIYRYIPKKI